MTVAARNTYTFHEQWTVPVPPQAAWKLIANLETYPRWWKEFLSVTRLNEVKGVGARFAVYVKSALPYHMRFTLESIRYDEPETSEVLVSGDLNGTMRWTLEPTGQGTRMIFEEEVYTGKPVLNVLAPVGRPAFAWNHRIMMKHGEQGLRNALASPQAALHAKEKGRHGNSDHGGR